MSKSISTGLQSHIEGEVTTIANCWKITRSDGVILGFTSHDLDVTFEGITYEAATGFTPSATSESVGLKVDNLELSSILDSSTITPVDLEAGLYDFAEIEIFQINYENVVLGKITTKIGQLGNIKIGRDVFHAEIRGLSQKFTNVITQEYTPLCRATLGDARCGVDVPAITVSGTIATLVDDNTYTTDLTAVDGIYDFGLLTFTSGDNNGFSMEVKEYLNASGEVKLFMKMPALVSIGDTFTVYPGCDKRVSVCKSKFANVINFRGEPYVPGKDKLMSGT